MAKKKIVVKTATTLGDIFKDKDGNYYEVFLKVKNGTRVRRYLAKGYFNSRSEMKLCFYNKLGRTIWSYYDYNNTMYATIQHKASLNETNCVVRLNWTDYVVHVSKQEVYELIMNSLRQKKLEINKQIIKLQNELYSVE